MYRESVKIVEETYRAALTLASLHEIFRHFVDLYDIEPKYTILSTEVKINISLYPSTKNQGLELGHKKPKENKLVASTV